MKSEISELRPTQRFSDRVQYYQRARPKYPQALLGFLQSDLGLNPAHRIADIGSGTGILAELFLRNGNPVSGVEPNAPMRGAGENFLSGYRRFASISATAEATTLADHSIDFIVAGQAFHWFDPPRARAEFQRILAPEGYVVLVWNERRAGASSFDSAYDHLIKEFCNEPHVDHHTTIPREAGGALGSFFGPRGFWAREFENEQWLDLEEVEARLFSASYMPLPDHPSAPEMLANARRAFKQHQLNGRVRMLYDTRVYYGKMT